MIVKFNAFPLYNIEIDYLNFKGGFTLSKEKRSVITQEGPALIYCEKLRNCCGYGNEGCSATYYQYINTGRKEFRQCYCKL